MTKAMEPIAISKSLKRVLLICVGTGGAEKRTGSAVDTVDGSEIRRAPIDRLKYPMKIYKVLAPSQVVIAGFLKNQTFAKHIGPCWIGDRWTKI